MRRREFLGILGGAAAWPVGARAQQSAMPVIGFLNSTSPEGYDHLLAAFRQGLRESDYVEGRNVAIEYLWANGRYDRLPALAAELVGRPVNVIVSTGGDVVARAAKAATSTIPVVFEIGADPVHSGLVASLNRPGGNLTGIMLLVGMLGAKRLGVLQDLVPNARSTAFIANPNNPNVESYIDDFRTAAQALGLAHHVVKVGSERDIEQAFASIVQLKAATVLVRTDPFLTSRRQQIVDLAARHAIPAMYGLRDWAEAGGLISYGTSITDVFRQVGIYTGKILKGDKPSALPVMQSTKFELIINLKTAKALGLTVPPTLLARADEVIE